MANTKAQGGVARGMTAGKMESGWRGVSGCEDHGGPQAAWAAGRFARVAAGAIAEPMGMTTLP